jgi:serine phosphatase RsbU (regulator of sigma subunit)
MQPGASYPVSSVELAPGDVLVAYTDGVTEAADPQGREFGTAGLERIVRQNRDQPAEAILAALLQGVQTHAAAPGLGLVDDLTLVVLKKDD